MTEQSSTAQSVKRALAEVADPDKAVHSKSFFKAHPGGYGEGDHFLGIKVPEQRKIARAHRDLSLTEIGKLVRSRYHEHRLTGFFILIHRYERGDDRTRKKVYAFCIKHLAHLDNWDLVDTVAPKLIGPHMRAHPDHKSALYTWAGSTDLWERRIAMLATLAFIRQGEFADALAIAQALVRDPHDLIHKAVGWMLREIGNRDRAVEEAFLDEHARDMPRTMLRYAIEKFPAARRQHYMQR